MDIKQYLEKLGIEFKTFKHPPVYTCEEAEKYGKDIRGIHSKNLFLKNKRSKNFYLILLPDKKRLEIKEMEKFLKDKIKFASEDDLKKILNLSKGAVSPFALINDKNSKVCLIIDKEVWESDYVGFHPNVNTETLELTKESFHKYVTSLKNKLIFI